MNYTLYNKDCFDAFSKLEDGSIDLVLVDPPYGTTAIEWDKVLDYTKMWKELERICKPNSNILMFASQPFTSMLVCSKIDWFKYELIWNKNKCGSPGLAKFRPLKTHENILVFSNGKKTNYNPIIEKGEPYKRECKDQVNGYGSGKNTHKYGFGNKPFLKSENSGTRYPKSILHCSRNFSAQQTVHPTQKPTNLLNWLILTYSKPNELVLDFTMGSGSTGVSAMETGRKFIGIEMTKDYFDIATSRINSAKYNSVNENTILLTTQNDFMKNDPPSKKEKSVHEKTTINKNEFFSD
jgi:site-specific DNA-methyltransferase (adenine-specific)